MTSNTSEISEVSTSLKTQLQQLGVVDYSLVDNFLNSPSTEYFLALENLFIEKYTDKHVQELRNLVKKIGCGLGVGAEDEFLDNSPKFKEFEALCIDVVIKAYHPKKAVKNILNQANDRYESIKNILVAQGIHENVNVNASTLKLFQNFETCRKKAMEAQFDIGKTFHKLCAIEKYRICMVSETDNRDHIIQSVFLRRHISYALQRLNHYISTDLIDNDGIRSSISKRLHKKISELIEIYDDVSSQNSYFANLSHLHAEIKRLINDEINKCDQSTKYSWLGKTDYSVRSCLRGIGRLFDYLFTWIQTNKWDAVYDKDFSRECYISPSANEIQRRIMHRLIEYIENETDLHAEKIKNRSL